MLFNPNKEQEICPKTKGLILGKLYPSTFLNDRKDDLAMATILIKMQKIQGISVSQEKDSDHFYSILLDEPTYKDSQKVQIVIMAINDAFKHIGNIKKIPRKSVGTAQLEIVNAIKALTKVNLSQPVQDSDLAELDIDGREMKLI